MADPTTHLDADALKVLAHPLRARLLTELRRHGPATATDLAQTLSTNSGATSYHLRKLEDAGLVPDSGQGTGRRRLWEAATRAHSWTPSRLGVDEQSRAALDWPEQFYVQDVAERNAAWLETRDRWPAQWWDVFGFSDDALRLTPEQARGLQDELASIVA